MIDVEVQSNTVTLIRTTEKEIYLVGTAHVSEESAKEVATVIEEIQPDHVAVELDAARYTSLTQGQDWSKLTINKVLKEGKGLFMLANLALSAFQQSIGSSTPGAEMKAAIDVAKSHEIPYSFADRDVSITLKRTWRKSSLWNKMKLLGLLIGSVFSKEELSNEDVESLKERGALGGMLNELGKELPKVKEVLVDERDYYLAHNIYHAPGKRVVAVVGAAHTVGMVGLFQKLEKSEKKASEGRLREFEVLPPAGQVGNILKWAIPLLVVAIIGYGFISAGWEKGSEMFLYWVLANGVLGGIGAIVALAHPITVIVTILAAPFTSLNPTIGVGFVSGALEGWLRKPQVQDFENLKEDTKTVKGFYRNRFTHALVVFFLTSLGSAIGTFVALPWLLSMFG